MTTREDLSTLTADEIEAVEKLTLRWVFQATLDFGMEAREIFLRSPDDVKDIAEDITRELLDRLPGHNVPQRIFGTVDYKKARYIILPDQTIRQALFVDSKAEKENRTATIQMSQSSMLIRQQRAGRDVEESGALPKISEYGGLQYLTTTVLLHFMYIDTEKEHHLQEVTLAAIPNGLLQDRYNPRANDTIWLAGRNAPTRGEDFRVRLSFARLQKKCLWRVQKIAYNEKERRCEGAWHD
ncbi:MAG: hypothetical protein A2X96_12465 [Syntrophobacterales bacterium GWC2_56_13]|nr:MAG: hypothetical protein A2X96_12465 [Syntrophobacterales bacterium GWC2_56_13]